MNRTRAALALSVLGALGVGLTALAVRKPMPTGNPAVPQPAKAVDLERYLGVWYELGRYEAWFERGMEGATAEYRLLPDGLLEVVNSARKGGLDGPLKVTRGRARIVPGSDNAKILDMLSFFGPLFVGDYWVLDHADDYSWSIVGEPSGRFLWLLCRSPNPTSEARRLIESRAAALGYDLTLLRPTQQQPA